MRYDAWRDVTVVGQIREPPADARAPIAIGATAVLTLEQLADWLQMSIRKVETLPIKCFYIGTRRRYLAQHVLEWMEREAR